MNRKDRFENFSFFEEIAYSLGCFEKLCLEWNLKSKKVAAVLEIFWGFADFDSWKERISLITSCSQNIERYDLENIDEDKRLIIGKLIELNICICQEDIESNYYYGDAYKYIHQVEQILEENNIELPALSLYEGKESLLSAKDLHKLRPDKYNYTNTIEFRENKSITSECTEIKLDDISIRGRFVFALECLTYILSKFEIAAKVQTFLEDLLEFTKESRFELWENMITIILPEELSSKTLAEYFGYDDDIDEVQQKVVADLIIEVLNVAKSNLYRKFENNITLSHINNIIKIMNENNMKLPSLNAVKFSKVTENNGLGNPFKCSIYSEWDEEEYVVLYCIDIN